MINVNPGDQLVVGSIEESLEGFVVRRVADEECWYFKTPRDVALFMWGKDLRGHVVFVGIPTSKLSVEIKELESQLDSLILGIEETKNATGS